MKILREPMLWVMVVIFVAMMATLLVDTWVTYDRCETAGGEVHRAAPTARSIAICHGPPRIR